LVTILLSTNLVLQGCAMPPSCQSFYDSFRVLVSAKKEEEVELKN